MDKPMHRVKEGAREDAVGLAGVLVQLFLSALLWAILLSFPTIIVSHIVQPINTTARCAMLTSNKKKRSDP